MNNTRVHTIIMKLAVLVLCVHTAGAVSLDSILEKHRAAVGGRELCMRATQYIAKGTYISSDGSWKRTSITTVKGKKQRAEMIIQPGMSMIRGYDGKTAWSIMPWSGSLDPQPMNAKDTKSMTSAGDLVCSDLIIGTDSVRTLSYKTTEEFDGSDCYVIISKRKDGLEYEYFLDVDSYLVVKITTRYRFQGEDNQVNSTFSNYKRFGGILLPTALDNEGGGTMSVSEISINPSIDDSIFVMPASEKNTEKSSEKKRK
ncbi:MAG: hypothetical protein ACK54V_01945 [Candidatus Kapaibacterium sp.]|jgi:hypothetical protein